MSRSTKSAGARTRDMAVTGAAPNGGRPMVGAGSGVPVGAVSAWQATRAKLKTKMKAKQVSSRGGELVCELRNDRVLISGKAVKFLEGKIELNI